MFSSVGLPTLRCADLSVTLAFILLIYIEVGTFIEPSNLLQLPALLSVFVLSYFSIIIIILLFENLLFSTFFDVWNCVVEMAMTRLHE